MNKKIFTLLVGALMLIGSSFMVNAQRTVPYIPSDGSKKAIGNETLFYDILTADTVKKLPSQANRTYYFLLSVTGVANADLAGVGKELSDSLGYPSSPIKSIDSTFVMYLDRSTTVDDEIARLRIERLARLDTAYNFKYGDSYKLGALRHASWCVKYNVEVDVTYSRANFEFTNLNTGLQLALPRTDYLRDNDPDNDYKSPRISEAQRLASDGGRSYIYGDSLDLYNSEFNLTDWHFSQSYHQDQLLQTGMPLYQYTNHDDSVAVLVLSPFYNDYSDSIYVWNDQSERDNADRVAGGYVVTVKIVALRDLIADPQGNVNTGANRIENVLLFTLKKVNPFTMNAEDWNSVGVQFSPEPTTKVSNAQMNFSDKTYLNPFTHIDTEINGWTKYINALTAYEVNDSLYHYGYMNFKANPVYPSYEIHTNRFIPGHWLYVDTAFVNDGNQKTLAFNWSSGRRDSTNTGFAGTFKWGDSHTPSKNIAPRVSPFATGTLTPSSDYRAGTKWVGPGNWTGPSGTLSGGLDSTIFVRDSAAYVWAYMKDSIMENQAKFRVVYDPYEDRALINAYQTRVRHNYKLTNTTGAPFVSPNWWENSFWIDNLEERFDKAATAFAPNPTYGKMLRPSDYYTGFTFDGTAIDATNYRYVGDNVATAVTLGTGILITDAAAKYYDDVISVKNSQLYIDRNRFSDSLITGGSALGFIEMHGAVYDPALAIYHVAATRAWHDHMYGNFGFNFHSAMFAEPFSEPTYMDKVMISTADTVALFRKYNLGSPTPVPSGNPVDWSALGHKYSYSMTSRQPEGINTTHSRKYQDSLLYVDLQGLGGNTVITLAQNVDDTWATQIKLYYGPKCDITNLDPSKVAFENDLYLIRNARGEYLCVPIWSATDSAYWVIPRENEDPTRMPCYQWAIVTRGSSKYYFTLTNREFPGVEFKDVWLPFSSTKTNGQTNFKMSIQAGQSFNNYTDGKSWLYGNALTKANAIGQNPVNAYYFDEEMAVKVPLITSFLRLNANVKSDQLLGYKYIKPDSTIIHSWAFKYLNQLAMGNKARYISWNGYDNKKDTLVRVDATDKYDKLFFDVRELDYENIVYDKAGITLTKNTIMADSAYYNYRGLFNKYSSSIYGGTTSDTIVFEKFGYWKPNVIPDLLPLARQAYRLFLQDYYKWHPTVKGHYMTLGGVEDNYVLADRMYATQDYIKGSYDVSRLFGIPHFYFRNTYFDVQKAGDDYFAILQRLDTLRKELHGDYQYGGGSYADVVEYLTKRFGSQATDYIIKNYKDKNQRIAFIALVEDKDVTLKMALRGDAAQRVSTFQLEVDEDPIYRRFHVNEPNEDFRVDMKDKPDTLVFHVLNQGDKGLRLYENSGSYKTEGGDRFGPEGGRVYNYINGDYMRDTLGHVISFLGVNVSTQYPTTNYSIYVDTAFINRGTGIIKPQYMLVVDPYIPDEEQLCDIETGEMYSLNGPFVVGRYLYNTSMYAKEWATTAGNSHNFNVVKQINQLKHRTINGTAYTAHNATVTTLWERFAFSWAIHRGDSLYVLKGKTLEPIYKENYVDDPREVWQTLADEYGDGTTLDFDKLISESTLKTWDGKDSVYKENYFNGDTVVKERIFRYFKTISEYAPGKTIGLHAIINLADNTHKDWVFSMRYVERGTSDFVIESETTDRDVRSGAVIRPGYGGWLKFDNNVPVVTRSDENEVMAESFEAVFNVKASSDYYNGGIKKNPVENEGIAKFTVIGGTGNVTILNAANKNVVITNVLGQTLVNTTITSANATIPVSSGIVVVAVEGENAVKAVVK